MKGNRKSNQKYQMLKLQRSKKATQKDKELRNFINEEL